MMKTIKRILLGVFLLIAGFTLFLIGSVVVDFAIGKDRINTVTNTTIPGQNGSPDVRAFVAVPPGSGPFPVVIMIHEFYGLNESIVGKAEGLAREGYLVVAPDTFRGSTTAWIPRAIYQVITNQAEQVNQDLDTVFAWIQARPDALTNQTGIMGFCYGGRASLSYSLHNDQLAATVIFYGSPITDPQALRALPGPVLGIFGGADRSIPVEEVQAFETALGQAGIPHEISIYEGQPHAFVTDMEAVQAGGAQGQAWEQMLRFFEQNLKNAATFEHQAPQQSYRETFEWRYYLALAYEHAFGTASQHGGQH